MNASSPLSPAWTPSDAAGWRLPSYQSQRWRMSLKTENGWNLPASPSAMKCTFVVREVTYSSCESDIVHRLLIIYLPSYGPFIKCALVL